jgi:phage baseplate assembly protein W
MLNDFYGTGISYPLRISGAGRLRTSSGVEKIEESIRIILGTQHGERRMRPTFGCNLSSLAFAPNNEATARLARHYVETGLREWEPRIEVVDVVVKNDNPNGVLIIHISYRAKATQDTRSLVYPFYLEQPKP